jgi:pyruvate dehydrogenase E1 component beta subunit
MGAFYYLDAPVKRMGAMAVPLLADLTVPTEKLVFEMAKQLCGKT